MTKTAIGVQEPDWKAIQEDLESAYSHMRIANEIAGRLASRSDPRKRQSTRQVGGRIHRIGTQLKGLIDYMAKEK